MLYLNWEEDKNKRLKKERGISFEDIQIALELGGLIDAYPHPNSKKYPKQRIMVVKVRDYAYLVPYIKKDEGFFLKTIIPSRKATKKYLKTI